MTLSHKKFITGGFRAEANQSPPNETHSEEITYDSSNNQYFKKNLAAKKIYGFIIYISWNCFYAVGHCWTIFIVTCFLFITNVYPLLFEKKQWTHVVPASDFLTLLSHTCFSLCLLFPCRCWTMTSCWNWRGSSCMKSRLNWAACWSL